MALRCLTQKLNSQTWNGHSRLGLERHMSRHHQEIWWNRVKLLRKRVRRSYTVSHNSQSSAAVKIWIFSIIFEEAACDYGEDPGKANIPWVICSVYSVQDCFAKNIWNLSGGKFNIWMKFHNCAKSPTSMHRIKTFWLHWLKPSHFSAS